MRAALFMPLLKMNFLWTARPTRSFAVKRRLAGRSAYLRPHRTVRASRTFKSDLNNAARKIEHPFFNFNFQLQLSPCSSPARAIRLIPRYREFHPRHTALPKSPTNPSVNFRDYSIQSNPLKRHLSQMLKQRQYGKHGDRQSGNGQNQLEGGSNLDTT